MGEPPSDRRRALPGLFGAVVHRAERGGTSAICLEGKPWTHRANTAARVRRVSLRVPEGSRTFSSPRWVTEKGDASPGLFQRTPGRGGEDGNPTAHTPR